MVLVRQQLWLLVLFSVLLLAFHVEAEVDAFFGRSDDLTSFVTRPDIKVPLLNVTIHDSARVSPGYYFFAPYAYIQQEHQARKYHQACQTGPTIYDSSGSLVWTAACKFHNQNTCDFRVWRFSNGSRYLSAILQTWKGVDDPHGRGVILDDSFESIGDLLNPPTEPNFNMHELNMVDDGRRVLHIIHEVVQVNVSSSSPTAGLAERRDSAGNATTPADDEGMWILDIGFREIDIATGAVTFEWWAFRDGHVSLDESRRPYNASDDASNPQTHTTIGSAATTTTITTTNKTRKDNPWNWFHANLVDKHPVSGDFMLSSRCTDTIYKISGVDGHVMWRLGGKKSDFDQDLEFSRQHDARWVLHGNGDEDGDEGGNVERIAFLDNGADEHSRIRNISIARTVVLDRSGREWTARSIREIQRPSRGLTRLRENFQERLRNGNSLVCWSENAVTSEHGPRGELIAETRFASGRFVTYRGYKFDDFATVPYEPIVITAMAYGVDVTSSTTVVHVSWNGATEVKSWQVRDQHRSNMVVGKAKRTGFETAIYLRRYVKRVMVEAISEDGDVLGASNRVSAVIPVHWEGQSLPVAVGQSHFVVVAAGWTAPMIRRPDLLYIIVSATGLGLLMVLTRRHRALRGMSWFGLFPNVMTWKRQQRPILHSQI